MPEAVAVVANVPDVGKVTAVLPVIVKSDVNAPIVLKLPPMVMVLPVFAIPVPPFTPVNAAVRVADAADNAPLNDKLVPVDTPISGVTRVGDVDKTLAPEPVEVVTPVPPLSTGNAEVKDAEAADNAPLNTKLVPVAAPNTGVTRVGDVSNTGAPVPVAATHVGTPPAVVVNPALLTIASPLSVIPSAA